MLAPIRIPLVLLFGLAAQSAPAAETGGSCSASAQSVLLVLVPSGQHVASAAQGLSKTDTLVATRDTVIFADGRVVTSNLDSVSEHLNALGWAKRPIEIASAGARATPRQRQG